MNIIDKNFYALANEIKSLSSDELYYRIRAKFELVNDTVKKSCMDFFNKFGYWGLLDPANNNYEEIAKKRDELFNHIDDFVWFYEHLGDYRSKKTLYSILNNWYRYDFNTSWQTKENMYDDYFDLDLVKVTADEVVVDLGAYTGDTILSYINNYGLDSYKKIYCYEITPETFDTLKKNLQNYPNIEYRLKGASDEVGSMALVNNQESASANSLNKDINGNVEITTLDLDIDEKITLIKADIEGFEKQALLGSKNHIIKDHPKLLISVYHQNEDLWQIPKMIHAMYPEYRFYLRHHGSNIYPTEITLIAIPPEE